jgi:hypothetical protein
MTMNKYPGQRTKNLAKLGPTALVRVLADDQLDLLAQAYGTWLRKQPAGLFVPPYAYRLFVGRRHQFRRLETAALIQRGGRCKKGHCPSWFTTTSVGTMILLEFHRSGVTLEHVTLPLTSVAGDGYHRTMRARLRLALRNYKLNNLPDLRWPMGKCCGASICPANDFAAFVAEGLYASHDFLQGSVGVVPTQNDLYWLRRGFLNTLQLMLINVEWRREQDALPVEYSELYDGDQDEEGGVTIRPPSWEDDSSEGEPPGLTYEWALYRFDACEEPEDEEDQGTVGLVLQWYDNKGVTDNDAFWLALNAIWSEADRDHARRVLAEAWDLLEVLPREGNVGLDSRLLPCPPGEGPPTHCPETGLPYHECTCELEECRLARGGGGLAIIDDCRFEDPLPRDTIDPEDHLAHWLASLMRAASAAVPRKLPGRVEIVREVRFAGLEALTGFWWRGKPEEEHWIGRHDDLDSGMFWEWRFGCAGDSERAIVRWSLLRVNTHDDARRKVENEATICWDSSDRLPYQQERLPKLIDRLRRIAAVIEPGKGPLPVLLPPRYHDAASLLDAYAAGWLDPARYPIRADRDGGGRYVRFWIYDPDADFVVFLRDGCQFRDDVDGAAGTLDSAGRREHLVRLFGLTL